MHNIPEISSVLNIADKFDAFCIDMYGVIWDGAAFYPSALPVLARLKEMGKQIYILSNTTKPSAQMESEMVSKGLIKGENYDGYISSGTVLEHKITQGFFEQIAGKKDYKFHMVGGVPSTLFKDLKQHYVNNPADADIVYFGSPALKNNVHASFDYLLPEMEKTLELKKPVVIGNPDYFAMAGDKKYARAGSMGKWYQDRGGTVHWVGKPYNDIYEYAIAKINKPAGRILMIGDTLRTDIAGGKHAGLKTLLITGTGITNEAAQQGLDLPTQFRLEGVTPDYLIERFQ